MPQGQPKDNPGFSLDAPRKPLGSPKKTPRRPEALSMSHRRPKEVQIKLEKDALRAPKGHLKDAPRTPKLPLKDAPRIPQGYPKDVPRTPQGCSNRIAPLRPKDSPERPQDAPMKTQGRRKDNSKAAQGCPKKSPRTP